MRRRAVSMVHSGRGVSEVARLVGVCPRSVSRWLQMYAAGGERGLDSKPQKGPSPRLSPDDLHTLERELLKGPRAHGFPTELWTLGRVAEVSKRRFGVTYHLWGHTKHGDLANYVPEDIHALRYELAGSLDRKRRNGNLLRSFFRQGGKEYEGGFFKFPCDQRVFAPGNPIFGTLRLHRHGPDAVRTDNVGYFE